RVRRYTTLPGNNEIRPGLNMIRARLEANLLKVVQGTCPNLLAEADLYRFSDAPAERTAEIPVDEHNHALAALRYLLSKLDAGGLRIPRDPVPDPNAPPPPKRPRWED